MNSSADEPLHGMMLSRQMKPKFVSTSLVLITAVGISIVSLQAKVIGTQKGRTAAQLYSRYCSSCHGRDGRSQTSKGKYGHARDLTDAKWQDDVSDERIYNSIMHGRNGGGNMPGFANKLKEKEANALVEMIRGLRR
ncbi:MAG: hypothetical protein DMF69_00360 [Acidobacteria bacterium]|nr:MAG: hypothetical protein DMF69_00360 [Acidobacteriota bacterium]